MVRLRPLERSDYGRLVDWIDSPELLTRWGGTPFAYPLTEEQLREHFESDDAETARRPFEAVVDGRMIGVLELNRFDREHRSAAISRVFVEPAERNGGVCKAMLREVLTFGFETLDLHRIHLSVFDFNEQAIACYEAVGFVREGVFRDSHHQDGEYWSTIQMSMLEDEWHRAVDGED